MKNKVLYTKKCDILRVRFDLITYEAVMETIQHWRANGEFHYVTITNPYSVMLCHRDGQMQKATAGAGLTVPDGVGIIIAAHLLGYKSNGRVAGPTLMPKLCDWGRKYGYRHYFYGGAEGVADRLAKQLSEKYPCLQIAGTYAPPFTLLSEKEDQAIVEKINATNPDIVWVGLGTLKQETWMAKHIGKINATAMIGVGQAFDIHSGTIKWAPVLLRRVGLEWAYRLAKEPKRLWRRNLETPKFMYKVICQRLRTPEDSLLLRGRIQAEKNTHRHRDQPKKDTSTLGK